jgi:hypothetical protein
MNHYMAVSYNGKTPTFTPTPTLDAARAHLCHLLNSDHQAASHTMSIIDIETNEIIYFRRSDNSVERVLQLKRPTANLWHTLSQQVSDMLSQLNVSFAGRW